MRLLVYPHELTIGGSQINAIDLAAGAAAKGHEVVIYGLDGPLVDYVHRKGLRFVAADRLRYRPAPSRIMQLANLCARERIELVHAYEWPPCLEACLGAGIGLGVPVLCTMLSMSLPPYIPADVPLIVGTADLMDEARGGRPGRVWCLEPPIDTCSDHPGIEGRGFRSQHGVADDELLVVSVSRLAPDLKLDALVHAIDAADLLAAEHRLRLILVGDGPAREPLSARAAAVNRRHRREVVSLPGADLDPRAAYAGADIVVGMGSSALRALAIGRPLVVQGEDGFCKVFGPETLPIFLSQGFYGLSDGDPGAVRLAGYLRELLADPGRREALGRYGSEIVRRRFSLDRALAIQLDIYETVLAAPQRPRLIDTLRAAALAFGLEVANHDPRLKRSRRAVHERLLQAARDGTWPPPITP